MSVTLHEAVDRALTAQHLDHIDQGAGFLVPALMPYPMTDLEATRWLADLGIVLPVAPGRAATQLTDNEKWPRGNNA